MAGWNCEEERKEDEDEDDAAEQIDLVAVFRLRWRLDLSSTSNIEWEWEWVRVWLKPELPAVCDELPDPCFSPTPIQFNSIRSNPMTCPFPSISSTVCADASN